MKAIALQACLVITPGKGQQLRHPGQRRMKGSVEAGHLRQCRVMLSEQPDQLDLTRQMIGVIGADCRKLGQQSLIDDDRLPVTQPMNDPMADSQQRDSAFTLLQPVEKKIRRFFIPPACTGKCPS
jgi:hypothetical protein